MARIRHDLVRCTSSASAIVDGGFEKLPGSEMLTVFPSLGV